MWLRFFFSFLVMVSSLCISAFLQAASWQLSGGLKGNVSVGALIPLTGKLGSLGGDVAAGIKIGVEDYNQKLSDAGADWRILLELRDTGTKPDQALEQLEELKANNISLILGPVTSASLNATKPLASDREILLFSPSSVATDHSTSGDGVFRLVPDAETQAEYYVNLILEENINTLVVVFRDDTWGKDLSRAISDGFREEGGEVMEPSSYHPDDVNADDIVDWLNDKVTELAQDRGNLDGVAVVILSFEEIGEILASSETRSMDNATDLDDLQWFGAASTYPQAINETDARNFANKVQYTTVILNIDRTLPIYERVRAEIKSRQEIDREPDVHSYIGYDTVPIMGEAIRVAQSNRTEDVIEELPGVAANYQGFVGTARLNENGDLMTGSYQRWQVINGNWSLVTSNAVTLSSPASSAATSPASSAATFNGPTVMVFMSALLAALFAAGS